MFNLLALVAALIVAGCASAAGSGAPTAAEIPALEARIQTEPGSVPLLVRLGEAYRQAGRMDDARAVLERGHGLDRNDAAAAFYLGLTYEDVGLPAQAREVYSGFLQTAPRREVRRIFLGRLHQAERQEMVLAVRGLVARETELAQTPPQPRTVAVFPFVYRGDDPSYASLGRALAEMLVTDLSQTERLRVLERTRAQLLVDELSLAESQLVDTVTAARSGRLLGAEQIVHGQVDLSPAQLRMQAAAVGTTTGTLTGRPLVEQDALQQLFEMQKRLAVGLYEAMGIQLTPAELERVTRMRTRNVQALLAYGECLAADDQGRYADAASHCQRAARLDPGFTDARERADQVAAAALPREAMALMDPRLDGLAAIEVLLPPELPRAAIQEVLGSNELGLSTRIDIIIRKP